MGASVAIRRGRDRSNVSAFLRRVRTTRSVQSFLRQISSALWEAIIAGCLSKHPPLLKPRNLCSLLWNTSLTISGWRKNGPDMTTPEKLSGSPRHLRPRLKKGGWVVSFNILREWIVPENTSMAVKKRFLMLCLVREIYVFENLKCLNLPWAVTTVTSCYGSYRLPFASVVFACCSYRVCGPFGIVWSRFGD